MIDLENEVCRKSKKSFHLIPYKLSFKPHGVEMCNKLSGRIAGYSTKEEYEQVTKFISDEKHQRQIRDLTLKELHTTVWKNRSGNNKSR